jgi:hypothetical protein
MAQASFASMHLACFEALRASEDPACTDWPGILFCQVGADSRAAGVDPASREALVFVAHARSGDAIAISSYLGTTDTFDRAIALFAESYANQNERDYKALLKAVDAGSVETGL